MIQKPKVQRNHNLMATPTPMATPGFSLGSTPTREVYGVQTPGKKRMNNDIMNSSKRCSCVGS